MRHLFALSISLLTLCAPAASAETLAQAVRAALASSPRMEAYHSDMQAAGWELEAKRGAFDPTLTLHGEANYGLSDRNSTSRKAQAGHEIGLRASVPLYDGYRRANQVFAGRELVNQRFYTLVDASETISLAVSEAYLDVYRHRLFVLVAKRNLDTHQRVIRKIQVLVDGGRLARGELYRARERGLAAEMALADMRNALSDADVRFQRVVGRAPKGKLSLPTLPRMPATREALVQAAVNNSSRRMRADAVVRERMYEQKMAEAEFAPQVSLNAGLAHGSDYNRGSGTRDEAYVGLSVEWTLYSGGRRAKRQALSAHRNTALHNRMATVREVEEVARLAWNALEKSRTHKSLLKKRVGAQKSVVAQYQQEFEAATRGPSDVLDAQDALNNLKMQEISARAGHAYAAMQVMAAQSRLGARFGVDPQGQTLLDMLALSQQPERKRK